jgi:RNA polymerase sigma-70 factor, ECF subfamily
VGVFLKKHRRIHSPELTTLCEMWPMLDPSCDKCDATDQQAVQRITEVQLSLYRYLSTLVFSHEEIDEIRQETNLTLWRKRNQFFEIENFHAWARRIAYLEVLVWRRRKRKAIPLLHGDVLEMVARNGQEKASLSEDRATALIHCVQKLSEKDRTMLHMRYYKAMNSTVIGEKLSRSPSGVRHSLLRIHRALRECVKRGLAAS